MNGDGMVIRNGNQVITMGPGGMKITQGNDTIEMNGNGISQNSNRSTGNNMFSGSMGMPNFDQIFGNFGRMFGNTSSNGNNFSFSYSTSNQQPPQYYSQSFPQPEQQESEGLTREEIRQFPVRKFSKAYAKNHEQNSCAICQEDYKVGEKIMTLTCFHAFHSECSGDWLKRKATCPICKTNM